MSETCPAFVITPIRETITPALPPIGETTKKFLETQRGRLCNERARIRKEIERLKDISIAIDCGIDALEKQISGAVVDNIK